MDLTVVPTAASELGTITSPIQALTQTETITQEAALELVRMWPVIRTDTASLLITHLIQMKLFNAIAAAAVIGASFITPTPVKAGYGCYPSLVVPDYKEFVAGGAAPRMAMELSLGENTDGSTNCKYRVNAALKKAGMQPYYFR